MAPILPSYGQGTASANWAVDYGVLIGAAAGAAIGGALAPGYIRHRMRATIAALAGAAVCAGGTGLAVIAGLGHEDPKSISLKLLAALALPAAAAGAALMRGLGVGE